MEGCPGIRAADSHDSPHREWSRHAPSRPLSVRSGARGRCTVEDSDLRPGGLTDLEPRFSNDPPTGETPPTGDVRHNLIVLWADIAARHAIVRRIEDPDELVATVAGIPGAWGSGATPDEALSELHSVLIGWATLKVNDGDRDIPTWRASASASTHEPAARAR